MIRELTEQSVYLDRQIKDSSKSKSDGGNMQILDCAAVWHVNCATIHRRHTVLELLSMRMQHKL
jgi:hypothetical protein